MLALTGVIAILPASQAAADHVPGATYSGTHEQGGPVTVTLTPAGQGCVGAKNRVKKLKKKLKNADSAQQKKKLRKKLRKAKADATGLCNEFHIPPGTTPTGTLVKSITVGGPIIVVVPGTAITCTILGPTETFVSVPERSFRPEVFDANGLHSVPLEGSQPFFGAFEGLGGFGPRTLFGRFDLTSYRPIPGFPPSVSCKYIGLRWTATS